MSTILTLCEHGTTPLPCRHCAGEGRHWTSRYGGNDPDVWDAGPCDYCHGSGEQSCQYCDSSAPAVAHWTWNGQHDFLCQECHETLLAASIEEQTTMRDNPCIIDDDNGEITVTFGGRELRGWSYDSDNERRQKMVRAREYVEGWCNARAHYGPGAL